MSYLTKLINESPLDLNFVQTIKIYGLRIILYTCVLTVMGSLIYIYDSISKNGFLVNIEIIIPIFISLISLIISLFVLNVRNTDFINQFLEIKSSYGDHRQIRFEKAIDDDIRIFISIITEEMEFQNEVYKKIRNEINEIPIKNNKLQNIHFNTLRKDIAKNIHEFLKDYQLQNHEYNDLLLSANIHEKNEQYNEALEKLTKAIEINPHSITTYHNRASIYLVTKDYDKALNDILKVVKINPREQYSYFLLAQIYNYIGNNEFAKRFYKIAMIADKLNKK